jgi:hypothetical protein
MRPRTVFRSGRRVFVLLVAAIGWASNAFAAAPPTLSPFLEKLVTRARGRAARSLEDPECQKVLAEFRDAAGHTLRENLDSRFGVTPAEYLQMIPFLNGSSQPLCRWTKVMLVTTPGVARVFVCDQFAVAEASDPWIAEAVIIHELLHTLGLGENPPTSTEITKRVKGRCR